MLRRYGLVAAVSLAIFPFTSAAYSGQVSDAQLGVAAVKQHKDAGLSQRGIIVVGGKNKTASHRTLNAASQGDGGASQKGIIVVGGKNKIGSDRMLNPQPLPPRERASSFGQAANAMDRLTGPSAVVQSNKAGTAAKHQNKGGELQMIQLQSVVSQRQQAIQMTTEMMKKQSENSSTVIRNIR
jgi:hypothetical protein